MRRYIFCLIALLFVCGAFSTAYGQKAKQPSFYVEAQPDSPLLIRDLTATILEKSKSRNVPEIEVVFYIENISKKKVKYFSYGDRAADGSDEGKVNEEMRFTGGSDLSPGEWTREKFTCPIDGKPLIYRIASVLFEDNTSWKAKPFKAATAKKSAPVAAVKLKFGAETKLGRMLTREWSVPIFSDRVTKTLAGKPQVIDGIAVQTKIHYIEREDLADVEFCRVELDESEKPSAEQLAMMSEQPALEDKVESFTSYEINGRVFAYSIYYESVDAKTGEDIGVGFENIYVDETGSGIFKLYCVSRNLNALPEWVKALAKAN